MFKTKCNIWSSEKGSGSNLNMPGLQMHIRNETIIENKSGDDSDNKDESENYFWQQTLVPDQHLYQDENQHSVPINLEMARVTLTYPVYKPTIDQTEMTTKMMMGVIVIVIISVLMKLDSNVLMIRLN